MRRPASQSAGRANPINTQEAQINGHRASRGRSLSALFAPPSANKLRPERSGAKLNMIHWRKAPISAPARRPRGAQSGWGRRACSSSWPERLGSAGAKWTNRRDCYRGPPSPSARPAAAAPNSNQPATQPPRPKPLGPLVAPSERLNWATLEANQVSGEKRFMAAQE